LEVEFLAVDVYGVRGRPSTYAREGSGKCTRTYRGRGSKSSVFERT